MTCISMLDLKEMSTLESITMIWINFITITNHALFQKSMEANLYTWLLQRYVQMPTGWHYIIIQKTKPKKSVMQILTWNYQCSTSSISLASTFSFASRKQFTRVSHVNGFRPFPPIHFCKIVPLISVALCAFSMEEIIIPLSSSSKNVPNVL